MIASTAGTIPSGRLWRCAGRYRTSTMASPSTVRSSPASAPHAITSGRAVIGALPRSCERASASERATSNGLRGRGTQLRSRDRWPRWFCGAQPAGLDELLGGLGGDRGVAAVGVGPDGVTELLVQRRPADEDDELIAQTLLGQRVDDDLHVRHRRG